MNSILEYLEWRGDLPFSAIPLNDVDLLVLSRVVYAPFAGMISCRMNEKITIGEAARCVLKQSRSVTSPYDIDLLKLLTRSPRFSSLNVSGFVEKFDTENAEQFTAMTIELWKGLTVVAFRGTDFTITGWKEDFNMSFADAVPGQLDAVAYLRALCKVNNDDLLLVGHSKGGNLSVYSCAFADEYIRERIVRAVSFDGPGFLEEKVRTPEFQNAVDKMSIYVPQSSVIGMLLEHSEDYTVIESTSSGLMQHNLYRWHVTKTGFITLESRTNSSRFIDSTLKDWVRSMTPEQRENMINGLFEVLESTGVHTFRDLLNMRSIVPLFRAMKNLDPETRHSIAHALSLLKTSAKGQLKEILNKKNDE